MKKIEFVPTEAHKREVAAMAAAGLTEAAIARAIVPGGLAQRKLGRTFREELATARTKALVAVASALYAKAAEGDVAACKLWLDATSRQSASGQGELDNDLAAAIAEARRGLERKLAYAAAEPAERSAAGAAKRERKRVSLS